MIHPGAKGKRRLEASPAKFSIAHDCLIGVFLDHFDIPDLRLLHAVETDVDRDEIRSPAKDEEHDGLVLVKPSGACYNRLP